MIDSSWVVTRFRSAWLSQNADLLVLKLLRESSLTEWEILSRLNTKYGLNPSAKEFAKLERTLVGKGFASLGSAGRESRLQITPVGIRLLRRLEQEYRQVVSCTLPKNEGHLGPSP